MLKSDQSVFLSAIISLGFIAVSGLALFFALSSVAENAIVPPTWHLWGMLLSAAAANFLIATTMQSAQSTALPVKHMRVVPMRIMALSLAPLILGLVSTIHETVGPWELLGVGGRIDTVYDPKALADYFEGLSTANSILASENLFGQQCKPTIDDACVNFISSFGAYYLFGGAILALVIAQFNNGGRIAGFLCAASAALYFSFHLFLVKSWAAEPADALAWAYPVAVIALTILVLSVFAFSDSFVRKGPVQEETPDDILSVAVSLFALVILGAAILGFLTLIEEILTAVWSFIRDALVVLQNALDWTLAQLRKPDTLFFLAVALAAIAIVVALWRKSRWFMIAAGALVVMAAVLLWVFACQIVTRDGIFPKEARTFVEENWKCVPCSSPEPAKRDVCGIYKRDTFCPQTFTKTTLQSCTGNGMTPSGSVCGCKTGFARIPNACGCQEIEVCKATGQAFLFQFNEHERPIDPDRVAALVRELNKQACSKVGIKITGYADKVGPDKYNCELSAKRAATILRMLIDAGLDLSRVPVVSRQGMSCAAYSPHLAPNSGQFDFMGESLAVVPETSTNDERQPDRKGAVEITLQPLTQ